jgi:hypothetical protein
MEAKICASDTFRRSISLSERLRAVNLALAAQASGRRNKAVAGPIAQIICGRAP